MGEAMRAAGVGPEIEYKGRVYRFAPVDLKAVGKFEAWLERQAWESAYRQEPWMPADKYRDLLRDTRRDVAAKVYSFGREAANAAGVSPAGLKEITLISLRAGEGGDPDCDGELVEEMFKAKPDEMRAMLTGIGWLPAKVEKDDKADAGADRRDAGP